jgi:phospho-N-acetylmuramoyl-pentapeptide-transferase
VISILIAGAAGLAVALLGTPAAIRAFRIWGWGQRIREDGPHTHMEKMGTPTMGGVVMLCGLVAGYLASRVTTQRFTVTGLALVLAAVGFGAVGFLDDFMKVRNRRSLGLTKLQKFGGTAVISILFAVLVVHTDHGISTDLSFVRPTGIGLGVVLFCIWAFLMLTASSNAVNLTDGLDGLAAGSSILVCVAYIFIAFWQFRHTCALLVGANGCYAVHGVDLQDAAIVAAAMMGAATGFLWWNAAPARIFMGDTGSLALGGLIAGLSIVTRTELLLVVIGGVFVVETLSVALQIVVFRTTRRRLFRMAPFHHHFELAGWAETTVIIRFWLLAAMCAALGLGLFYSEWLTASSGIAS